jgi:ATP-dependent Clp protease ATP-binding subunit ClpX
VITFLNRLDRTALLDILTKPKNALIKQYKHLFVLDGIRLSVDKDVMEYVVDTAMEFNLGARGLRSICEAIMVDAMYEGPSSGRKSLRITLPYAQKRVDKITKFI